MAKYSLLKAYIIIPVYNRRETTLACLGNLREIGDLEQYRVIVVDDGSIDGTSISVRTHFPTVTVLKGTGNLWWAGAIAKGMKHAYQKGAEYFVWLNDDTIPSRDTISKMLSVCLGNPNQIVTAQCYEDNSMTAPTYGGRKAAELSLKFLHAAADNVVECDVCSGNLVCFSRGVIDAIGYPTYQKTPQTWADVIYTWRAKQAGFYIAILGNATAVCPFNPLEKGWTDSPIPMMNRWKMLGSPKSSVYPPAYWFYCKTIHGSMGIVLFLKTYLSLLVITVMRSLLPLSIVRQIKHKTDTILGRKR
ncbi:MAG: glycosyltransferase family 2 protein [Leptolyngbyaceae cyanobacterium]